MGFFLAWFQSLIGIIAGCEAQLWGVQATGVYVSIPHRDYSRLRGNGEAIAATANFCVSIPHRDYSRLREFSEERNFISCPKFQSLIGIIAGCERFVGVDRHLEIGDVSIPHRDYSRLRASGGLSLRCFNLFQSLIGIIAGCERSQPAPPTLVKVFQSLIGIIAGCETCANPTQTIALTHVSIPHRDYSRLRGDGLAMERSIRVGFQSLIGIIAGCELKTNAQNLHCLF